MSKKQALILFVFLIVIWGVNWPVTKMIVLQMPPLWSGVVRYIFGIVVLFAVQCLTRQFIIPSRHDLPVVICMGLINMTIFTVVMVIGLQLVSVGRSAVLSYTTPLWVAPAAWLFLRESMSVRRIFGVLLGLSGVVILFNPLVLDWSDRNALIGNGMMLGMALLWSASILIVRGHKWAATPFQLTFWQMLLALFLLTIAAFIVEGPPDFTLNIQLVLLLLYAGVLATSLAFWMLATINKNLPATTTSLGLLATPVVGIVSALIMLGEPLDLSLVIAGGLIILGIIIGTFSRA